jgi:hypothetical protein
LADANPSEASASAPAMNHGADFDDLTRDADGVGANKGELSSSLAASPRRRRMNIAAIGD